MRCRGLRIIPACWQHTACWQQGSCSSAGSGAWRSSREPPGPIALGQPTAASASVCHVWLLPWQCIAAARHGTCSTWAAGDMQQGGCSRQQQQHRQSLVCLHISWNAAVWSAALSPGWHGSRTGTVVVRPVLWLLLQQGRRCAGHRASYSTEKHSRGMLLAPAIPTSSTKHPHNTQHQQHTPRQTPLQQSTSPAPSSPHTTTTTSPSSSFPRRSRWAPRAAT